MVLKHLPLISLPLCKLSQTTHTHILYSGSNIPKGLPL